MQVEQKIKGVCVGRKVGKIKFVIQPDPPFGAQRFFEEKGILYYIDLDLQHWFDKSSRHRSFEGHDIALGLFSIVDPDTFRKAEKKWIPEVLRYSRGLPFIIIGTKSDLRDDEVNILRLKRLKSQKPVTREEGEALAKRTGAISYHEWSAKFPETFLPIGRDILKTFMDPPKRRQESTCNIL